MNNHPVWTVHLQKAMKTYLHLCRSLDPGGSWSTFQLPNLTCPLLLESRMIRYCNPCDTHLYRTKRCWDMALRISAHEERLLRMVIIDIVTFCWWWDHRCHFSSLLWLGPSKQIDSELLTAKMYPLVMTNIAMERSTMLFMGKSWNIHYFYGHFQ